MDMSSQACDSKKEIPDRGALCTSMLTERRVVLKAEDGSLIDDRGKRHFPLERFLDVYRGNPDGKEYGLEERSGELVLFELTGDLLRWWKWGV